MSKKIDKEREQEDITTIANWILYECDSPEEEVEFLLKLLYTQKANYTQKVNYLLSRNKLFGRQHKVRGLL